MLVAREPASQAFEARGQTRAFDPSALHDPPPARLEQLGCQRPERFEMRGTEEALRSAPPERRGPHRRQRPAHQAAWLSRAAYHFGGNAQQEFDERPMHEWVPVVESVHRLGRFEQTKFPHHRQRAYVRAPPGLCRHPLVGDRPIRPGEAGSLEEGSAQRCVALGVQAFDPVQRGRAIEVRECRSGGAGQDPRRRHAGRAAPGESIAGRLQKASATQRARDLQTVVEPVARELVARLPGEKGRRTRVPGDGRRRLLESGPAVGERAENVGLCEQRNVVDRQTHASETAVFLDPSNERHIPRAPVHVADRGEAKSAAKHTTDDESRPPLSSAATGVRA